MTREEYANALLLDVAGLDSAPAESQPRNTRKQTNMRQNFDADVSDDELFGADDPVKQAGLSTLPVQLTIANAQQLGNSANGLDLFKVDDVDAAALPTGVVSPALAAYKNVIKYLLANPSQLRSIVISSNESATGGAPVLSSVRINPKRVTPFGLQTANEIRVQAYQTTQDFQANRITIPLSVGLDAFTFLNLVSDVNGSGGAVTLNLTLMVGKRAQAKQALKNAAPMRVMPGGRGPVAIKR